MGPFQGHHGQTLFAVVIRAGTGSGDPATADAGHLAVGGLVEQDERVSAHAAHGHHCDGLGGGHGQCGIKGIAPILEHLEAGGGGQG